jgi:hypothetical protein
MEGSAMSEVQISPLAKRLAEENSIDWRKIRGTGPEGRVIERDILTYLARIMSGEADLPAEPDKSEPAGPSSMPAAVPGNVANYAAASAGLAKEGVDLSALIGGLPPAAPVSGLEAPLDFGSFEPIKPAAPTFIQPPAPTFIEPAPVAPVFMPPAQTVSTSLSEEPVFEIDFEDDEPDIVFENPIVDEPTPVVSAPVWTAPVIPEPTYTTPKIPEPIVQPAIPVVSEPVWTAPVVPEPVWTVPEPVVIPTPIAPEPVWTVPAPIEPEVAPVWVTPTPVVPAQEPSWGMPEPIAPFHTEPVSIPEPVFVAPEPIFTPPAVLEPKLPDPIPEPVFIAPPIPVIEVAPVIAPVVIPTPRPMFVPAPEPVIVSAPEPVIVSAPEVPVVIPAPEVPVVIPTPEVPVVIPTYSAPTSTVINDYFQLFAARREFNQKALEEIRSNLSNSLNNREIPNELFLARAVGRAIHLLGITQFTIARLENNGLQAYQVNSLQHSFIEALQGVSRATPSTAEGLLVVDASSLGADDLILPSALGVLALGRNGKLTLSGNLPPLQSTEFLSKIAELLENPVGLVI